MSTPCRLWASGVLSIRQQGAGLHGLGAPSQAWCVDRTAPRPAPAWSCHQGAAGPLESPRLWAAWPGREALAALHTWMDEGPRAPTGRWMTPLRTQLSHSATVRGEARRWDTMGELVTAGRKGLGLQTERGGDAGRCGVEGRGGCGGSHGTVGPCPCWTLPRAPWERPEKPQAPQSWLGQARVLGSLGGGVAD